MSKRENKHTSINWYNTFVFILPKSYIRFSPNLSYAYKKRYGWHHSAEGNRLLGREGLDSVITTGNVGEDFLHLVTSQTRGRTRQWGTSGDADSEISLKPLHMNTLSLRAHYQYYHDYGYDMQQYQLLIANGTTDKRNRYDNQPMTSYEYNISAHYPIVNISRTRKINQLSINHQYTQKYHSSERLLYRLDKLGDSWMPDKAPIGMLPSATELHEKCLDSLNDLLFIRRYSELNFKKSG